MPDWNPRCNWTGDHPADPIGFDDVLREIEEAAQRLQRAGLFCYFREDLFEELLDVEGFFIELCAEYRAEE